jgi:hypothetical protein
VNDGSAKSAGYQDALLCIRNGVLRIKWYYFPGGTKRIPLTRIVGVEEYRMSGWTGDAVSGARGISCTGFRSIPVGPTSRTLL